MMAKNPKGRIEKRAIVEILLAFTLIVWRVAIQPLPTLWRDWVILLSVYWIYTVIDSGSVRWKAVTVAGMAGLFAVYFRGQVSYVLGVLGAAP